MRELTPEERYLLIVALHTSDPDSDECASAAEAAVYDQMETIGRVKTTRVETDEYEWVDWLTTDLGRLALRVCPVGELV